MREFTVDEVIAAASVSAGWLLEAVARERELESRSNPGARLAGWEEGPSGRTSRQARRVRADMVRRLSRESGAARRAAAICLARPSLSGYSEELDLALSGSKGWTAVELAALLTVVRSRELCYWDDVWLSRVAELALGFDAEERAVLREPITPLMWAVADSGIEVVRRRELERAIGKVLRKDPGELSPSVLIPLDGWAVILRDHLGDVPPPHLVRLVDHLCEVRGPRPAKKWRARCLELLRPADAGELVRVALAAFDHVSGGGDPSGGDLRPIVLDSNVDAARGFVWAAVLLRTVGLIPALTELALRAGGVRPGVREDLKLAGAAINALGDCEGPDAMTALWRLQRSIRHRALRKQVGTALDAAAARQGITPGQLLERGVPDHGLAPDGTLTRTIGDWTAVLAVEDAMTVRLGFRAPDGTMVRAVPAELRASGDLRALRAVRKEVRQTLSAERARLEGLLTADRTWTYEEWARHYRDHPITGAVTRALIWEAGGEGHLSGGAVPDATLRLWHPARARPAEVTAWREEVTERRLRQPFKQAFREVYLLPPAEEESRVHSDRFAARIVDHPRLYALLKERGWRTGLLGPFAGGHGAEAEKELAEGAWRVRFGYETAGAGERYEVTRAVTGQVRFERRDGRSWRGTELTRVPPPVFSEGMRDVDLFVAVAAVLE
ncbi:DUF4132 domain-containing protein [Streptosporangium roseum]|uniref:DUF4132 domain-containing protein n=1 Tax=Streptosporangium roseum TaxID=2001 RepID=UPI0033330C2A